MVVESIEADVIVVGAGNAAFAAALSARQAGASVALVESAPEAEAGGNSRYTTGAMRVVYDGVDDLRALIPKLTEDEIANTDFGTYSATQFYDDMFRITGYRANPDMVEALVTRSRETLRWMGGLGIRFAPMYRRQAYQVDGRFKFWGGVTVEAAGGGEGLMASWTKAAANAGIAVHYGTRANRLIADDDGVHGVVLRHGGRTVEARSKAVVLACGGFEANPEWRTRYLGPGWDLAKVRGSRFNTGEGIRMALDAGAASYGNWSGCHAVAWDRDAPEFGDLAVGDGFQKHSYPLGIILNARGERFVDEGADFRNYTYAKYGRAILEQPDQFAWQVFDAKALPLLRDEYRIRQVTKVTADSLEDLTARLDGVDSAAALATIKAFNHAVRTDIPFDPNVKDGRRTEGLGPAKSNWANAIDEPPFEAYGVTCGITFTFGGLRIDGDGRVLDGDLAPLPGLHAAGELVGGLFYFNYPGGTGLTSGAVFGRLSGATAGHYSKGR
ncbi:MAG: FAD-dependent tricarballylate dehydrogenase TcuA [Alphaproteobacteria bacterium]